MPKLHHLALAAMLATTSAASSRALLIDVTGDGETFGRAVNAVGTVTGEYGPGGARGGYVRHPDGGIETFAFGGDSSTQPYAINAGGQVVGVVYGPTFGGHGFLRQTDGTLTLIDYPSVQSTAATAINGSGTIVGTYQDSHGKTHSFLRSAAGSFRNIDVPGMKNTQVVDINEAGAVLGTFERLGQTEGFILEASGSSFDLFDPPDSIATFPTAIASDGSVAGYYIDSAKQQRGFERSPDPTSFYSTFLPDGAKSIVATDINDQHVVVGYYSGGGAHHGFLRTPDGTIQILDVKPRLGKKALTLPFSINESGAVAGDFAKVKKNGDVVADYGFLRP